MKLAILGSSAIALEAALRFHAHEAALSWFNAEEGELEGLYTSVTGSWDECTTELGRKFLKESGARPVEQEEFSWQKWKTHYYLPLVEFLKIGQEVRPHPVITVTKRFLSPSEEVPHRSRFQDLFRVIYEVNPEEFIGRQKEMDPATYEKLSEEFVQSLQSTLEMYEDFDLVLDLRHENLPTSLAVTGRALGEGRIKDKIFYGLDVLRYCPADHTRELALVGSADLAAEVVIRLSSWLDDPRMRLFIVAHEEDPFEKFLEQAKEETQKKVREVFQKMNDGFQKEVDDFHKKLREWQALDDFVRVKKPKPVEPIPRLVFFSGHNVTAVDQLVDRRRIFLTIERPDWRQGLKQPENNDLDLKTIGVDEVLGANGLQKASVTSFLREKEKGLMVLVPHRPNFKNGWKEDLNALKAIENEIFELFSPADSNQL